MKLEKGAALCPVHGMPDCSPLLTGCTQLTARPAVTMSDASLRRLREAAIQVLGEHRLLTPLQAVRSRCSCGWRWRPETDYVTHLAEALIGEDIGTEFIDAVVAACQAYAGGQ